MHVLMLLWQQSCFQSLSAVNQMLPVWLMIVEMIHLILSICNAHIALALLTNLPKTLRNNSLPSSVIENVVRKFLNNDFIPDSFQSVSRKDNCLIFKLPYIGAFSIITQRRIKILVNTLCSDLEIKLVFTPFKIKTWFGAKDPIPAGLRSRVIFHVQAVVPVILVKLIDTLPLAFVNILPPTNILTSLSTWEVLKIVAPLVQNIVLKSSTLLQQVSN